MGSVTGKVINRLLSRDWFAEKVKDEEENGKRMVFFTGREIFQQLKSMMRSRVEYSCGTRLGSVTGMGVNRSL
jgi:hypothetical protein